MSSPTPSVAFAGRVVLITGASSGIGAATARAFAAAGASLVLNGRNAERLEAVADSIRAAHPSAQVVTQIGDAGKEETLQQLVELALSKFGALHIAFNNAASFPLAKLQDITSAQVDEMLSANVKSVIYGLKHQLPAVGKSASKEQWGVIINNSSAVSTIVKTGFESMAVYAASKSAVDTLSKFGALEGAPLHVRVLSINLGPFGSEGAVAAFGGSMDKFEQAGAGMALVQPVGRMNEVAQTVLFLADNQTARFITGSNIVIDGGASIK